MEKAIVFNRMFLFKFGLLLFLSVLTFNAYAYRCHSCDMRYQCSDRCYNTCNNCNYYNTGYSCGYNTGYHCGYNTVTLLSGPDCNGYYRGSNCTTVRWVGAHWDPYGNYVPGYWLAVGR